jgi:hypothetical protein
MPEELGEIRKFVPFVIETYAFDKKHPVMNLRRKKQAAKTRTMIRNPND